MMAKLDNVKCIFGIGIDPIVPSEKNYDYKCLVTTNVLSLKVYNLENLLRRNYKPFYIEELLIVEAKFFCFIHYKKNPKRTTLMLLY